MGAGGLGWWRPARPGPRHPRQDRSGRPEAMATRLVREIIQRNRPLVGRPEDTVQAAAEEMAEHGCGSILVCDGKELRGIFTERDLLVRVVAAGRDAARTRLAEVMTREPDTIAAS